MARLTVAFIRVNDGKKWCAQSAGFANSDPPMCEFRLQFTEDVDGEQVLFGPAPMEFSRASPEIVGMKLWIGRKCVLVLATKLRDGGSVVRRGEMVGLVVRVLNVRQS